MLEPKNDPNCIQMLNQKRHHVSFTKPLAGLCSPRGAIEYKYRFPVPGSSQEQVPSSSRNSNTPSVPEARWRIEPAWGSKNAHLVTKDYKIGFQLSYTLS